MTSLWSITQGVNESLESYTERFTATYSCVTNLNEELAIQAYILGVANENIQLSLCSNDVGNMESLISKVYNRMIKEGSIRIVEGGHPREIRQITDQSPQDSLFTGSLRITRPYQSEGRKS